MKKVFISQPMRGKTDEQILAERESIKQTVTDMLRGDDTVEIIDSFIAENAPEDCNQGLWYLAKSLELLATADIAVFANGWEDARGCRVEHIAAQVYDITYINL